MTYRVAVIEDNPADRFLLEEALQQAGLSFELISIEDGQHAQEYIQYSRENQPDLILLDLNLPRTDGLELFRSIRRQPSLHNVPVIIWSSGLFSQEHSLVADGLTRFFVKPTGLEAFLQIGEVIRETLAGRVT